MNKTINSQSTLRKSLLWGGSLTAMLFISLFGLQNAYAAITTQLDIGERGEDVTELQTYLATNASIYPSGLVTGYFGPLTQAGVQRFQAAQGIVTNGTPATTGYGRVGPQTMVRLNALIGGGSSSMWDTVPIMSTPLVQRTTTTATFAWSTNEPTQGQVYWSASPIVANEATGPNQQPYVSGSLALDSGGSQTSHAVTISNLQANTLYYYLVRGIDSAGNVTITWPNTFRTNQ